MSHVARLPRCTPAEAGLDPHHILDMIEAYRAKGIQINSFLLVRHGRVLCEGYYAPYAPDQLQTVYSLSKTFTSMAVGIAAGEGILDLDEKVIDIFPDELAASGAAVGRELSSLTLRHLLRMSTGQPKEPERADSWGNMPAAFLAEPFADMPGETFRYNTIATYMLSASLKKRGVDLEDYLQERLFNPLGIHGTRWLRDPRDTCAGGFGLSLYPEVIARLGLCILNHGQWEGRQLIPADYLALAATPQIYQQPRTPASDWNMGYGYQMWMCQGGSFRGDGMHGQFCVMDERTDSVLAMTALSGDMQGQLNIYREHILNHYGEENQSEDASAMAELTQALAALRHDRRLPEDDGGEVPVSLLNRRIMLPEPVAHSFTLHEAEDGSLLMDTPFGELPAGRGKYLSAMAAPDTAPLHLRDQHATPMLTAYGVSGGALTLRQYSVEFIEETTLTLTPSADGVHARVIITTLPDQPQEIFSGLIDPA